ncbi:hypothetical protein CEXT_7271, partial [Caerostris extrusa]
QDNSSMLDATPMTILWKQYIQSGTMDIDISSESNIQCRLSLFYNAGNETLKDKEDGYKYLRDLKLHR